MKTKSFIGVFVFLLGLPGFSQNALIDSLRLQLSLSKNAAKRVEFYSQIAHEFRGVSMDSLLHYTKLIAESKSGNKKQIYYYNHLMHIYMYHTGDYPSARLFAFHALDEAASLGSDDLLSDASNNLGIFYLRLNVLDSADMYFRMAGNHIALVDDPAKQNNIMRNHANVLNRLGRYDEALELAVAAIAIDSSLNNLNGVGFGYFLLGNTHYFRADYPAAISAYTKAASRFEEGNRLINLNNVLQNLGVVLSFTGQHEKAIEIYRRNLELLDQLGNERDKIGLLVNLATAYNKLDQRDKQAQYLNEALLLANKHDDESYRPYILSNLGVLAFGSQEYAEALFLFRTALDMNQKSNNAFEQASNHINIGKTLMHLGQNQTALASLNQGFEIANQLKANEPRLEALRAYSQLYEKTGNYRTALDFNRRAEALNDSILGEKSRNRIAELEVLYETEKKERELGRLRQSEIVRELEINKKKLEISRLHAQRTGLGVAVLFIALMAFIWFTNMRNRKEREKNRAVIAEREAGLKALFEATENERKRIAKDLHDSVGQQLGGLKLAWKNIESGILSHLPAEAAKLSVLSKTLDEAAAEVRSISHQMMPRVLQEEGLVPAIADMLEKAFRNSEIQYNFEHYGVTERFQESIEIGLFRICQELVSNIIKHADASHVNVQLFRNAKMVVLLVEDNGKGFAKGQLDKDGIGMLNISSRVETINGEFNLEPSPQTGVLATIRIPTT